MKVLKYILSTFLLTALIFACTQDDLGSTDLSVEAPTNISALFQIAQDNTGDVTIIPSGEGAVSYVIDFGDNSETTTVNSGKSITHTYAEGSYSVIITATGITGLTTEVANDIVVSFKAPENLVVSIENDAAISKQVNVTATADYAISYEVYFGEEGNDTPVTGNNGETVSYTYQEAGTYTIKIVSMSGAVETTEYTEEFVVTAILQPLTKANNPTSAATDVVSIYSDKYTNIVVNEWNPGWGQTTVLNTITVDGSSILKYDYLNYTGIVTDYDNPTNVSEMEYVHFDYWTNDAESIGFKIVNTSYSTGNALKESEVTQTVTEFGKWVSVDIPLSSFTTDMTGVTQMLFVSNSVTVFIDNLYFYKTGTSFDDGLLTNGDFENGSELWLVGVDDASSAPVVTDGDNTYYSVNVTSAGNSYDVNLSQKVEIIQGNTYTLTFDAWSDVNRSIIAGIGLSADPWSNNTETVNITTTRTTYSLTLAATGFGATNARVIFDLGNIIGMVNIDNVSLSID